MPAYVAGAVASERISTLAPWTRSDRGIEDNLLARLHTGVRFRPRAEVSRRLDLAHTRVAVVDHPDLQAIAVEDDRFCGHAEGWRFTRTLELDGAVDAGWQRVIRVGNIDLGQERAGAALRRVGDPSDLAEKLAIWDFRYANDRINAWRHAKGGILRHVDKDADHVPLHDLEHERASVGVALHQSAGRRRCTV